MRSSSATRTPIIPAARCRSCARFPSRKLISSLPADHPIVARAARTSVASRCFAGTQWQWDRVTFTLLHPDARHYADSTRKSNDLSCVLRIESAGGRVLFTGDIEARSEAELLQRAPAMAPSDVLVVPHHGSRTSSTSAFIAAVSPRVAVVRRRLSQSLRPSARRCARTLSACRCRAAADRPARCGHVDARTRQARRRHRRARVSPPLLVRRAGRLSGRRAAGKGGMHGRRYAAPPTQVMQRLPTSHSDRGERPFHLCADGASA